jgi:WD40 repeat protein
MWIQKVTGGGVEGLAYSPDGGTLYTADRSGRITAWNTATREGRCLVKLDEIERCNSIHLAVLADRSLLINGLHWIVWDPEKGVERSRVPVEFAQRVFAFDSVRLYSQLRGHRSVATWDLPAGRAGPIIDGWNLLGDLRSFDPGPDGETVVLTDTHGYVTIFDRESQQEVYRFEPQFPSSQLHGARFSPQGDALVLLAGHRIRFWDVKTRTARGEIVVSLWHPWVSIFHPTAPVFVALNREVVLTLYSTETGQPIRSFDFALGRYVQCACFAPDGLTCAVGGSNKQFAVFDVDL